MRKGSGRRAGHRFDADHGVVTEALIFLGELDPDAIGPALEDATHYEPTPLAECGALLGALPPPPEQLAFVDIGAGMGRVLLLATQMRFRQIVGVEVSPALCEVARQNVAQWRKAEGATACSDVRIVCSDAATARLPRSDAVFYLYNPFGETSLRRLVERIVHEVGGRCAILYHTPLHRAILDRDPRFAIHADLGFGIVYVRVPEI